MPNDIDQPFQPYNGDDYASYQNQLSNEEYDIVNAEKRSFWYRVKHGVEGESRVKEFGRSLLRGGANLIDEVEDTVLEAGAWTARRTGLGEVLNPGYNDSYDDHGGARGLVDDGFLKDEHIDAAFGERSEDPIAAFAESMTQFTVGFFATGPLKILQGAKMLSAAGIARGLIRGGIVDFAGFDPYEETLSNMLRETNIPGISDMAGLLAVNEIDNVMVARMKKMTEGAILGGTFEGIFGSIRMIRGVKVLADEGASPAAKAAAKADVDEGLKAMEARRNGDFPPEDTMIPKEQPDGSITVEANPKSPHKDNIEAALSGENDGLQWLVSERTGDVEFTVQTQRGPYKGLGKFTTSREVIDAGVLPERLQTKLETRFPDDDVIVVDAFGLQGKAGLPDTVTGEGVGGLGTDGLGEMARRLQRDYPEVKAIVVPSRIGTTMGGHGPGYGRPMVMSVDQLARRGSYKTLGHAEAAAASMNKGIKHTEIKGQLGGMEQDAIRSVSRSLRDSIEGNDEAFADFLENGNEFFNFSAMNTTADETAILDAMTKALREEFEEAVNRGVPKAKYMRDAKKLLSGLAEEDADEFLIKALENPPLYEAAMRMQAGDILMKHRLKQVADQYDLMGQMPHDIPAQELGRRMVATTLRLAARITGNKSETGRILNSFKDIQRGTAKFRQLDAAVKESTDIGLGAGGKVKKVKMMGEEAAADATTDQGITEMVAGMTVHRLQETMRNLKTGGFKSVKDIYASIKVIDANRIRTQRGGAPGMLREFFVNSLLSHPTTWATIVASGVATTFLNPMFRVIGGALSGNMSLMREGFDMYRGWSDTFDALRYMKKAFINEHSTVFPRATNFAIPGKMGTAVRMPGRIMGSLDEGLRVFGIRSYVRAKSLRQGRLDGLSGADLIRRTEVDLRNAFDESGRVVLPEAAAYGEIATFSGLLRLPKDATWGGIAPAGLTAQTAINNMPGGKFLAPFVKASVNLFRYAHDMTPGLNLAAKRNINALRAGGEEAAIMHAKTVVGTTLIASAGFLLASNRLTGRGPSDPRLRKAWLEVNQPYSVRVGDKWVSYRRADPFGMPLGMVADFQTAMQELDQPDKEWDQIGTGFLHAMMSNFSSKTYMSGLTDFFEAVGSNDSFATERWVNNFTGGFIPRALQLASSDEFYREVHGPLENAISKIPGMSSTLPAKRNLYGEPIMKTAGFLNKTINPFTIKDVQVDPVIEEMLSLEKTFAPHSGKLARGMVDLKDPRFAMNSGEQAYTRFMDLIDTPMRGHPSLREELTKLVGSTAYKQLSPGSELFPGGARWKMVMDIKSRHERRALRDLMRENRNIRAAINAVTKGRNLAARSFDAGAQSLAELFQDIGY